MMRRISFNLTQQQVLDRTKTVTRRLGWRNLKTGERLQAVDRLRSNGAKKLAVIEVVDVREEPLSAITDTDVEREGFTSDYLPTACGTFGLKPLTPSEWFVDMFSSAMSCHPDALITRIEFRYVDGTE